jgi:hypothetical protein
LRYLATLNFNDFMPPNARESLACAAQRWGMQYLEIAHPWTDLPLGDIFRHKLHICTFPAWQWGDEVTLIDGDILIRDDSPYPFSSTPTFAGVHGLQDDEAVAFAVKNAGKAFTINPESYVNGGLLRFYPKQHAAVFALALRMCGHAAINPMLEQTAMNSALVQLGGGFEVVSDHRFNTVGEKAWTEQGMVESDQFVRHFARWNGKGATHEERAGAIQGVKWRVGT